MTERHTSLVLFWPWWQPVSTTGGWRKSSAVGSSTAWLHRPPVVSAAGAMTTGGLSWDLAEGVYHHSQLPPECRLGPWAELPLAPKVSDNSRPGFHQRCPRS